jgi:two-component system, chemotaxis family, sensor kinase CheA
MNDKYREAFLEEAAEHLTQLEEALLELEDSPNDMELIGKVFRSLHTIKGSGSMFGYDDLARFVHEAETVYDLVREGKLSVSTELINLSLKTQDIIRMMLHDEDYDKTEIENVKAAFIVMANNGMAETIESQKSAEALQDYSSILTSYRIRFRPHSDLFQNGTNPLWLLRDIKTLGTCTIEARVDSIPSLEDCDPGRCYLFWDIDLATDQGMNAIKDVFIFVEDLAEITIEVAQPDDYEEEDLPKIGEILVERGDLSQEVLAASLNEQKRLGQMLVDQGIVAQERVKAALAEQQETKNQKEKKEQAEAASSIRVPVHKLDALVDLVGELVTVQARIARKAGIENDPELQLISEQVERLTSELRDNTMNIRMLPIGTTFGRFKRLVRDLSGELGKDIELVTEGGDTELDKTVLDRMADPLVHLIRNSIDHGIEPPEVREARGKPRIGTISLSAAHSGANVVITIKDDGNGLDKDAIMAKAFEKGIAVPGIVLSDKDIFNFIFHPGFSTADKVTNVSGRGVGMDVVKKTIDALKGTVNVDSVQGSGTTVSVELPLTLAIVEGLLVTIRDRYFVLPLSVVEECIELTREDVRKSHGHNLAYIRGEIVPYIRLRNEFDIAGDLPDLEQIVVTGTKGRRVGLVVDNVVGQHQTVIKSLGRAYRDIEGISGATILGDGTVALVVDTLKLLEGRKLVDAVFN